MKNLLQKFWNDEAGFVISLELVLVATILVIGLVAGLAQVRDAVVFELGDIAAAASVVDQSFGFGGVSAGAGTDTAFSGGTDGTSGTGFADLADDDSAGVNVIAVSAPGTATSEQ